MPREEMGSFSVSRDLGRPILPFPNLSKVKPKKKRLDLFNSTEAFALLHYLSRSFFFSVERLAIFSPNRQLFYA
jgi:hypothetical protein